MTTYIENLKSTFESQKHLRQTMLNEIEELDDQRRALRNIVVYLRDIKFSLSQVKNHLLPLEVVNQIQELNKVQFDQNLLDTIVDQMHTIQRNIPDIYGIENIIKESEKLGLTNDTFKLYQELANSRLTDKGYVWNPSNFKNTLINPKEYEGKDVNHIYIYNIVERGSKRKIDKALAFYISRTDKALYVYVLDMASKMRTCYMLGDNDTEVNVSMSLWIKDTDYYQPVAKLPKFKREDLIEEIKKAVN